MTNLLTQLNALLNEFAIENQRVATEDGPYRREYERDAAETRAQILDLLASGQQADEIERLREERDDALNILAIALPGPRPWPSEGVESKLRIYRNMALDKQRSQVEPKTSAEAPAGVGVIDLAGRSPVETTNDDAARYRWMKEHWIGFECRTKEGPMRLIANIDKDLDGWIDACRFNRLYEPPAQETKPNCNCGLGSALAGHSPFCATQSSEKVSPMEARHDVLMRDIGYAPSEKASALPQKYHTTPGTIDGPCIHCGRPFAEHCRDEKTYAYMCGARPSQNGKGD